MSERSEWEQDDKEIRRKKLQQRERTSTRRDQIRPRRDPSNRPRRRDWMQFSLDEDDFEDVSTFERITPRSSRRREAFD